MRLISPVMLVSLLVLSVGVVIAQYSELLAIVLGAIAIFGGLILASFQHEKSLIWLGLLTLAAMVAATVGLVQAWGTVGAVFLAAGWALLLVWLMRWLNDHTYSIEKRTALLINRLSGPATYIGKQVVFPPVWPGEEVVAIVPNKLMEHRIKVEDVPTRSSKKLQAITFRIKYKIRVEETNEQGDSRAFDYCSNIDQPGDVRQDFQARIKDRTPLSHNADYWEAVLRKQIEQQLKDFCHEVVPDIVTEPKSIVTKPSGDEASQSAEQENLRQAIVQEVRRRLAGAFLFFGVEITELSIFSIDIDPKQLQNPDKKARDEAQRASELEAQRIELVGAARAKVQAKMIVELVRELRESELTLSDEEFRHIVRIALDETSDRRLAELAAKQDGSQQSTT